MANYSDGPSMDEILSRIKRALAERENRAEYDREPPPGLKEYARSKDVTERILEELVGNDIFIKPSAPEMKTVRLSRGEEVETPVRQPPPEDVFVLTKSMKVSKTLDFSGADFDLLCENLAVRLARDLGIPYLVPKIEEWFRNFLAPIIMQSKK
jgi:hypothetical protein